MKVFLLAAISADGYIAQTHDQLADWTGKADKRFFVKKTKEAGVLIMGRTTYATIGRPLPDRLNIVMTRTPDTAQNISGSLEFTDEAPEVILERLEKDGFRSVVIGGGAQVYSQFLEKGLVTDIFLTVESVLFGGGVSFVEGIVPIMLQLKNVERLGEEAVLLHYSVL